MSYQCDICGKNRSVANKVSHSNIKTKKVQKPNLHRVHVIQDGQTMHVRICTRCLRSGKVVKI